MNIRVSTFSLLATALIFSSTPLSADSGPLHGELTGLRVIHEYDGSERFAPAEDVQPGDLMEYRLSFQNKGAESLSGLTITGPVPANTEYVSWSASGNSPHRYLVSVDGGESFEAEPVTRVQVAADGTRREVEIPPSQYTHLRWNPQLAIGPGQQQVFHYRVRVR